MSKELTIVEVLELYRISDWIELKRGKLDDIKSFALNCSDTVFKYLEEWWNEIQLEREKEKTKEEQSN